MIIAYHAKARRRNTTIAQYTRENVPQRCLDQNCILVNRIIFVLSSAYALSYPNYPRLSDWGRGKFRALLLLDLLVFLLFVVYGLVLGGVSLQHAVMLYAKVRGTARVG